MSATATCAKCGAELEIPDDPMIKDLLDGLNKVMKQNEGLAQQIKDMGGKAPAPVVPSIAGVKVKKKRTDTVWEGLFFDLTEEVEFEEEEGGAK